MYRVFVGCLNSKKWFEQNNFDNAVLSSLTRNPFRGFYLKQIPNPRAIPTIIIISKSTNTFGNFPSPHYVAFPRPRLHFRMSLTLFSPLLSKVFKGNREAMRFCLAVNGEVLFPSLWFGGFWGFWTAPSKNRGYIPPKMDGENNGNPYFLMDDLRGKPTIFGNIHLGSEDTPSLRGLLIAPPIG